MDTIKKIFKIGYGPSSSHTMGPSKAANEFGFKNPNANSFRVTLYGSLASTGKGHLTDVAIENTLAPKPVEIIWKPEVSLPFHPNALLFEALDTNNSVLNSWTIYSVGGGDLKEENEVEKVDSIYPLSKMASIMPWCYDNGKTFWEYVELHENSDFWDYLMEVWRIMQNAVRNGLENEGTLPGGLNLQRKAPSFYVKAKGYKASLKSRSLVYAYALAVAEENAGGGKVVTAPTCGSAGVLPAVLYHLSTSYEFSDKKILRALATAGLIANLIKTNASISGAQVGCQGEIGSACSMAAAAANQLFGGTLAQVEYAAEMGLEHHLGLTCDPVCGLVQIPCIERNAFAAARALDANIYSMLTDGRHHVSFDRVVNVLRQTGHDIPSLYRETALGGLASISE
jgi:L-serine dehydratase